MGQARVSAPIVIADDDDDVRDVLSLRFANAGYDVRTASHGAQMITVLQGLEGAKAIFVDLLMPGVVGHSVIDFVQHEEKFAGVPVAAVTGSPELAPAGVKVFPKPARFDELLAFAEKRAFRRPPGGSHGRG